MKEIINYLKLNNNYKFYKMKIKNYKLNYKLNY